MKPIVALSTCWCSGRHNDGYEMLKEIAELGFEYVELSHGIRLSLVPGVIKAVEEGVVKVSSAHNFCPLPAGVNHAAPNLYMPSEPEGKMFDQWMRQTKRSLDFAHQMKAQVLVVHLGAVEFFFFNPGQKLRQFLQSHPGLDVVNNASYRTFLAKRLKKLQENKTDPWRRVQVGIEALLPYAEEKNIKLGLENREKFEELPLDADFPEFLNSLSRPASFGYWHDTGHAAIKEEMGLIQHPKQIADNEARLIGFHLHDVTTDGHDHQPIGSGKIDFEMISTFWKPHHLLTIELSPKLTVEEVLSSKAKVESLLEARGLAS